MSSPIPSPNPPNASPGTGSTSSGWLLSLLAQPWVRKTLAVVVAALVPTGEVGLAANEPELLNDEHEEREATDSALWIAQITDPHLFEEFKGGRDAAANEAEDQQSFQQALRFVGSGEATQGRVPDALVITGDFGVDSLFLPLRPAGRELTRAEQVTTLARLLRQSPVKDVYVVIGNNDLADENANIAAFAYFHRLIDEVSDSVRRAGIRLRDLSACYAGAPARTCAADLRNGVRLVGFASASFKNSPRGVTGIDKYDARRRALRADSSRAWDSTVVERLAGLVSASRSAGRQTIVLTHEPDVVDPYARSVIDTVSDAQRRAQLDPAVWNIAPPVRARWDAAVTGGAVLAVIAGHLHSPDSADYVRPYSPQSGTNPVPVFVSPPLAVKNQDTASPQARGISLYRISRTGIQREIAWLHRGRFSVARAELVSGSPSESPRAQVDSPGAGLDTPARIGIAIFAILAAVIGVLGGFKEGMRDLRENRSDPTQFSWLRHLWLTPVIVSLLAGLVLVMILFANVWANRGEVAMWYGVDYLFAVFAAGFVVHLCKQ
jgi:3',5'-cyclic AMP phosphodiesterase CpdA